jgi:muramidase (phage lysozyme)
MNIADFQNALASNPNVPAFLKAIRLGEGTSGPDGYNMLVGSTPSKPLLFTDFSTHPNVLNRALDSTAAGAYQIIHPTWLGLVRQYGFSDFSPATQDQMAVALIFGRNALDEVIAGDLATAVQLCSAEWASLPGSQAGQRTESFDAVQQCYLQNGGTLETTT